MKTYQLLETDLCVIGGGLAGVCAALAAARNGAQVVLVQDRSVLGGNASSEIKMHVVGADCHGARPGARESGIIEELRLEDAFRNPQRTYSLWDTLLYEKVKCEPNATLLLESSCEGCVTESAEGMTFIRSALVNRGITEEKFEIRAKFFADCSGDGRLGAEAGADFRMGRESRAEFNESLAREEADSFTLGSSILFTARKFPTPQPFIAPSWVRRFEEHEFRFRPIKSYEYGYWWCEWGGQLNTIRDVDAIRHELLRITLGIWDYIKNSGRHPGAANYVLDWFGAIPGKRESRRFLGPHVLTQQDVMSGRTSDDDVAYGGWWIDLHPPDGVDSPGEPPCAQHHIPHLYGIPLRCLYSRNVGNLFFAGRNISATHVAFASTRVMATCSVMGQAVGTAAAHFVSLKRGNSISRLASPVEVAAIRQKLLRDDAFLPGVKNEDADDLARKALCRASSCAKDASPASVINGIARRTRAEWGAWSEDAANCWVSSSLPAWIELELPEPAEIGEVLLTFDSGLERELILSASDTVTAKVIRGPQPELVKDYCVAIDGTRVIEVRGNYLRRRRHIVSPSRRGGTLRIEIFSTHGAAEARVFEIRVYGPGFPSPRLRPSSLSSSGSIQG